MVETVGFWDIKEEQKVPFYFRGSLLETLTLIGVSFFFGFYKFPAPLLSYNIIKATQTKRNTDQVYRNAMRKMVLS